MKIALYSDLHLEFGAWKPPRTDVDVVVLAGDIHTGLQGVEWAHRSFPDVPVIYVAGNHEFYGFEYHQLLEELHYAADLTGNHVRFINNGYFEYGAVRFVATTLWTDFALLGADANAVTRAKNTARAFMSDFRLIRWDDGERVVRFSHNHSALLHSEARDFLDQTLAFEWSGKTVVVTHHCPVWRSIAPRFQRDRLTAAFASDLEHIMGSRINLWLHGHTHDSFDYVSHGTRVVCNPRGYDPYELNSRFDASMVLTV